MRFNIYIYTHISLGLLYINVFEVQRSSNFQVGSLKVSVDTPPVFWQLFELSLRQAACWALSLDVHLS